MKIQPLKILITVLELDSYSGFPLYTRDIALELKRQGQYPEVYTLRMGAIASELLEAGIHVTDNPAQLRQIPDIIHGQHRVSTLIAVKQFRHTPAIFICHNHTFWGDEAPFHPHIIQYFGVSGVCMDRLKRDGVLESKVHFLSNFVDTKRFQPRSPLPQKPRKALVFSNYANENTHLPAVREACLQRGLELDVIGMSTNYLSNPETKLGEYDIVFAKAKAAIEAMAVGCAVILCDFSGVGPMVTSAEFDKLRIMNFGFASLTQPLQPESILPQISRYDPQDAYNVSQRVRSIASLEYAAQNLLAIYDSVLQEYKTTKSNITANGKILSIQEWWYWERARLWACLSPDMSKRLSFISKKDPAFFEKDFIFERSVPQSELARQHLRLRSIFQKLLIGLWLIIPEMIRMRLKTISFISKTLAFIKRMSDTQ